MKLLLSRQGPQREIGIWARIVEEILDVNLIDEETIPLFNAWFHDFLELPIIKEWATPYDKLLEHNIHLHKRY
uniref:Uncharacterized protein n=1 Tax=Populus trichocarpa TaxID=3694 RepID=A0A2K2AHF9_POPTR